MKKKKKNLPADKDRQLDIPSEANRDKHINFQGLDDNDIGTTNGDVVIIDTGNDEVKRRRDQWQKGIEDGKEERDKENPE